MSLSEDFKVLAIEDDPIVQDVLRLILGPKLKLFDSFFDFWGDTGSAGDVDLILVDLCHPGDPDGIESVSKEIPKIIENFPNTECVVLSGIGEPSVCLLYTSPSPRD